MTNYIVRWECDIEASDPEDAAIEAMQVQQGEESVANYFEVIEADTGKCHAVDLLEETCNEIGGMATDENVKCLLEALKKCITENGAFAFASQDFYSAKQRLMAISNIAKDAISKITGQ